MFRGLYNQIPIQTLSFFYGHINTVYFRSGVKNGCTKLHYGIPISNVPLDSILDSLEHKKKVFESGINYES